MLARLSFAATVLLAGPGWAAPPRALIVAFGDSLTAGYALEPGLGFAPQLEASLRRHGIAARVVDGGVSGDTSAAARARLGWTLDSLPRKPDLVIVELGANDMLRGLDPRITRANMEAIVDALNARKVRVLVSGMRAAPNLDPAYVRQFEAIFPAVARRHGASFDAFFLDGVAGNPQLLQPDGMHPTFAGVKHIVSRLIGPVKSALAAPR